MLFSHAAVYRHRGGCFVFSAIMSRAAVNGYIFFFLCIDAPISPQLHPGLELLGQLVNLCLYLGGLAKLFLHNV